MSKAGYPYDNTPMERYFNTLKNECTNGYELPTEEELYQTVEEFAYATYNHVRPHSYNGSHTIPGENGSIRSGGSRLSDWLARLSEIGGGRFCQWQGRAAVRSTIDKS